MVGSMPKRQWLYKRAKVAEGAEFVYGRDGAWTLDGDALKRAKDDAARVAIRVQERAGIDIIMLDSDGKVEELIPLWLECGINFIYPMEVAAGMDVLQLRKEFGQDLIIGGGMDKRILASNKEAIYEMVMSKKELMLAGGYVPGVDHAIPPDISWENFMYYRQLLNAILP